MWVNRLMLAVVWVGAAWTCILGGTVPVLINPSFDQATGAEWWSGPEYRWKCDGAAFAMDKTVYRSAPASGRMTSASMDQVYTEQWFDTPQTMPAVGDTLVFSIWLKSDKTWKAGSMEIDAMTTLDGWKFTEPLCMVQYDRRVLTAEWQRYSVWVVRNGPSVTKMYFHIVQRAVGSIWMDDASLAAKGTTATRQSLRVSVPTRAMALGPARTLDIRGRLVTSTGQVARGVPVVRGAGDWRLMVGANVR